MKKIGFFFSLICIPFFSPGQAGMWTWMTGDSIQNTPGNFGTMGVPASANTPPSLYEPSEWTDLSGDFWLFGGFGGGVHDDLWKFNPVIGQWTWIKGSGTTTQVPVTGVQGVPSVFNTPGNQQWCAASWTDLQGNLWLFGGSDGSGSSYNLLWRYQISTQEWTWMKGSVTINDPGNFGIQGIPATSNNPPCRWETSATWVDSSGNLWLFGGLSAGGDRNDLWKYDISTNNWTWMKGSSLIGQPGVYGTLGVANSNNVPSARRAYSRWNYRNHFWLFGGSSINGSMNDLWKYNPATNEWTWAGGTNQPSDPGNYGPYCQPDSAYLPASVFETRASWLGNDSSFYIYGGNSFSSMRGDLWNYCPVRNKWSWLKGSSSGSPIPVFGVQGIPALTNEPGGKSGSVGWKDNTGNLWMFGGYGSGFGTCNDLWKFVPDTNCVTCETITSLLPQVNLSSSDTTFCGKKCIDFTDLSTNNPTSWLWLFPGADTTSSTLQHPVGICYSAYGTFDVTLIACNAAGCDTLFLPSFISEYQLPPQPVISQSNDTLYCTPSYMYSWYSTANPGTVISTDFFCVSSPGGSYFVIISDSMGCQNVSAVFNAVGMQENGDSEKSFIILPNPANNELTVCINPVIPGKPFEVIIMNALGQTIISHTGTSQTMQFNLSDVGEGIYSILWRDGNKTICRKFLILHQ